MTIANRVVKLTWKILLKLAVLSTGDRQKNSNKRQIEILNLGVVFSY